MSEIKIHSISSEKLTAIQEKVLADWIYELDKHYYDALKIEPELIKEILTKSFYDPNSEFYPGQLIFNEHDSLIGFFSAFPSSEIAKRRMSLTKELIANVINMVDIMPEIRKFSANIKIIDVNSFYLGKLYICQSERKKGIGDLVVKNFIEEGKIKNHKKLSIHVSDNNISALKLYRKHGFKSVQKDNTSYLLLEKTEDLR